MNVITKLAINRITTKKARSGVICAAIFLTIVLFMTVVSLSSNLLTGFGLMMRLAAGTDYHGYLRSSAFTVDAETLRDEMRQSNDIAEAYVSSNLTRYSREKNKVAASRDTLRALESEKELAHFYTTITEGTFPQTEYELLVNPLYFPDAKVGDTITLYYEQVKEGYSETAGAEFHVCGLMESISDTQIQAILRYSNTLEDIYGFGAPYSVYFMFDNTINITGKYNALVNETLGQYKRADLQKHGSLNGAYLETTLEQGMNLPNLFLIFFAVATVFLCSFLLIYNIYSIALVQDMQSFGLLNVLGTTHRQLRRMIVIQSMILYAVTLLPGMLAGYIIGWKLLAPVLFHMENGGMVYTFSPWIIVFTILLTLFTLLWSAVRPLKKLYALTPIATVEYTPAADLPKRYVRKKNYKRKNVTPKTGHLAGYTISRNRKKTVITAASMSISVILFVLIATIADYAVAYSYDMMQKTDYFIRPAYEYQEVFIDPSYGQSDTPGEAGSDWYDIDEGVSLTEEYIAALENSPLTAETWRIRTTMIKMDTPQYTKQFLKSWKAGCYPAFWDPLQQTILDGTMEIVVVGIPDVFFDALLDHNVQEIGDGYLDGYVMVQYSPTRTYGYSEGNYSYAPYAYFEEGSSLTLGQNSYTVKYGDMSVMTHLICGYLPVTHDRPVICLPEHHFLDAFGEGATYGLLLNAKEDCYDLMRGEIERLSEPFPIHVDIDQKDAYDDMHARSDTQKEIVASYAHIDGRMDGFAEMEQNIGAIQTVGYSLAAMIFLIGALNIVNTALSSATERKREFAMLEAVGMTDRQMMRMLLTESLYSGGVAVLITVGIGFPLIAVIINTAMDALVSLHWLSGVIMLAVCIAVSILSGLAVFRLTKSSAVVERIKVE